MTDPLKLVPKVTLLPVITTLDIPTERVLNAALSLSDPLKGVVVVGETAGGDMFFSSSFANGGDALWWLEKAKKRLLEI